MSAETTALTLNAALGLMALHPDFQDEMHHEVMTVMPTEADFVSSVEAYRSPIAMLM